MWYYQGLCQFNTLDIMVSNEYSKIECSAFNAWKLKEKFTSSSWFEMGQQHSIQMKYALIEKTEIPNLEK